jgi:hypothetical protein
MSKEQPPIKDWNALDPDEQTALRVEYGYDLDTLPPTCSLQSKIGRVQRWLREAKGVDHRD